MEIACYFSLSDIILIRFVDFAVSYRQYDSNRKKFGEILLDMGMISANDLDAALSRQRLSKKPLGQVFEELGVICDVDILGILAKQFNLKTVEEIGLTPVPKL